MTLRLTAAFASVIMVAPFAWSATADENAKSKPNVLFIVCDDLNMDSPKTKELVGKLKKLNQEDVLIIIDKLDDNLSLSARNLHKVHVCEAGNIDPVNLVGHEAVIMTSQAVKQVEEWLQ